MEADYAANKFLHLQEEHQRWAVLQEYLDFNVFFMFEYFNWYKEFQMFLYTHGDELKRKLTLDEFMFYGMKYRLVSLRRVPKDFDDFKSIKIKKA